MQPWQPLPIRGWKVIHQELRKDAASGALTAGADYFYSGKNPKKDKPQNILMTCWKVCCSQRNEQAQKNQLFSTPIIILTTWQAISLPRKK